MPVTITIKQVGTPDKVILGQQEKKALPTSSSPAVATAKTAEVKKAESEATGPLATKAALEADAAKNTSTTTTSSKQSLV